MPTYDYECRTHGYFELVQRMADHAEGPCPTCGEVCPQKVRAVAKHGLDLEAMSRAGMPGAFETVGDRITKRHRDAGQHHRPSSRK
jgi:putative FmdB family regulatory protein